MSPAFEEAYAGRRAVVTGGLGFIGSQVARRLVGLGARVSVVDALVPGCGGNRINVEDLEGRIEIEVAGLDDEATARCIEGADYVFNLAGQVSHVDSMEDPQSDLENNCRGHLPLLEACRLRAPEACIVYASTRQIYGRPQRLPLDEGHPISPVDVNGIHKWACETYHQIYHRVHGIRSVVLRLTNTYGPGQLVRHPRLGFMGWFLRRVVEGKTIEVMGDGSQLRDLNYVDDVVDALLLAAASPRAWGRIYNLGAPEPISLKELVETMIEIAGRGDYRLVPFPPERERIDIGSAYCDFGRIRSELGWEPRVCLREGLTRSIRFYERNLSRYLA